MKHLARSVITHFVLWCTILSQKTLKSFRVVIVCVNICVYRFEVALKPKCVAETFKFMFLSKRRQLVRRLLRLRVREDNEASSAVEREVEWHLAVRQGLLKRLEEHQLEMLLQSLENRGADLSACVLLPKDLHLTPHLLSCRMWRWPTLRDVSEIKRLPGCRSAKDPVYICCNPYHWSRLCEPESPPPPYRRFASECLKPEDRAPSEGCCDPLRLLPSLSTNGSGDEEPMWCHLAYWELSTRIGRLFSVTIEAVNVFTCLPHGDGFSITALVETVPWPTSDSVRRTRGKIGLGLQLSLESDGVWVYNRSEWPIFVSSPGMDDSMGSSLVVIRVSPGHCLNMFKRTTRLPSPIYPPSYNETGPVDPNTVRISFAKGWGPNYSRQDITACPCWLEVLLKLPCR